jgi:hypothetical protein
MELTEAINTPSTLINREMNCGSEEGSRFIRRAAFKPGDFPDKPINVEQATESSTTHETPNDGPIAPAPSKLSGISQPRIAIQGGVRGFLTLAGFDILFNWKEAVQLI